MKPERYLSPIALLLTAWIVAELFAAAPARAADGKPDTDTLDLGALMRPLPASAVYREADYFCWCPNIVKGEDGKYYLVYSRWPRAAKVSGWLTDSEVALAVAERPEGPFRHLKVLLRGAGPGHWDELMAHNPKLEKFGGKYHLYYISSRNGPSRGAIRDSQRTSVAVADAIEGPYRRGAAPIVEPAAPVFNLTVNPAVTAMPDGRYLMMLKGDAKPKRPDEVMKQRVEGVALGDSPLGPFVIQPRPAVADIDTEDPDLWHDPVRGRFYALFHAHTFIGSITSTDGLNWQHARHFEVTKKAIACADGSVLEPQRMERPDVFFEDGRPRTLCLGAAVQGDFFCILVPLR